MKAPFIHYIIVIALFDSPFAHLLKEGLNLLEEVCTNRSNYDENFALRLSESHLSYSNGVVAEIIGSVSQEQLECLKMKKIEMVFIRTFRNDCSIDPDALENLQNAYSVQRKTYFVVNVFHEPCMQKEGEAQFNDTYSVLKLAGFGQHNRVMHPTYIKPTLFLSVEHEISLTEWQEDVKLNRQLIDTFFWTANRHGFASIDAGVRSTRKEWNTIYGCPDQRYSHGLIHWYWNSPIEQDRIDSNAGTDYEPFGNTIDRFGETGNSGPAYATFKQYAWNQSMCGINVNLIYW